MTDDVTPISTEVNTGAQRYSTETLPIATLKKIAVAT
jgi:hypothetical protein